MLEGNRDMNRIHRLLRGALLLSLLLIGAAGGSRAQGPDTNEGRVIREGALVRLYHPVPALTGDASLWLNTEKPVTFEKGKVYVVHFWTFGCINCKRNLPHYDRWVKKFGKDVTFMGVHSPETESEKKFENVRAAVKKHNIDYPVLFDPNLDNWKRWQQQWWPTVYLIDKQGRVRYYWMGELEWQGAGGEAKMRRFIEQLLREPAPSIMEKKPAE
jgi:thiol-disulfide isomerase/thioredoxin